MNVRDSEQLRTEPLLLGINPAPNSIPRNPSTPAIGVLKELRQRGIDIHLDGDEMVVRGRRSVLTPPLKAKVLAVKPALVDVLRREQVAAAASYDANVRAWCRKHLRTMAWAHGYDEESIAIATRWLEHRHGAFRVFADRIEITLAHDVKAIIRHPHVVVDTRSEKRSESENR